MVIGEHDAMVATNELEGGRILRNLEVAHGSVYPERELLRVERGRVSVTDKVEAWRKKQGRLRSVRETVLNEERKTRLSHCQDCEDM
jgi:hypothetical protein